MDNQITEKPDIAALDRAALIEEIRLSWEACDEIGRLCDDLKYELQKERMKNSGIARLSGEHGELINDLLDAMGDVHDEFHHLNMVIATRVVSDVLNEYRERYKDIGIPF